MICVLIAAVSALAASLSKSYSLKRRVRRIEKIADGGFLLALTDLLARVAMADGEVTADEVETAEKIFSAMGLSRAEQSMCVGNFLLAQREKQDVRAVAQALTASLNHDACLFLYGLLWRVANADWRISEGEERLLEELGSALKLNDEERMRLRSGNLPALDRKALDEAGVPASLVRLVRTKDGVKDAGLGIWS